VSSGGSGSGGGEDPDWPILGGVEVLGWGGGRPTGPVCMETVKEQGGQLVVVERRSVSHGLVEVAGGRLVLNLEPLQHLLACPLGVRLTWAGEAAGEVAAL
jgi:hypothetical protein